MTPAAYAQNCHPADLRRDRKAVTGNAMPHALTSGNTSNGTRHDMTEAATLWDSSRAPKPEHRYQTCDDERCDRFPCRVYREGYEAGHAAGSASGYAAGRADGYAEGYADGQADAAE